MSTSEAMLATVLATWTTAFLLHTNEAKCVIRWVHERPKWLRLPLLCTVGAIAAIPTILCTVIWTTGWIPQFMR